MLDVSWILSWRQGDPHTALRHAEQAHAHRATAIAYIEHNRFADAHRHAQHALGRLGDLIGTAYTLDSLGCAHHHVGDHAQAIDCYQRALVLHRQLGDRHD